VALSCGALPADLVEAELFGAVKGAYTGLDRDRPGMMALARTGTIFLDEIGELPLPLQPKLLRALQERSFRPLGGAAELKADFRLICATHRDLEKMVEVGQFRQDLLFRVQVFPLDLPPLRERPEDIEALALFFKDKFNRSMGRRIQGLTPEALDRLKAHHWPGNVRELSNAIEYAFVLETEDRIREGSLPRLRERVAGVAEAALDEPSYRDALASFERAYLQRVLERNDTNWYDTYIEPTTATVSYPWGRSVP
jgi:transcriptional regulator with PAS, ATPase and Fis domain